MADDASVPRLLPLPLTVFERLMATDARPSCPMTFVIELSFIGRLDRELWDSAVQEAVARHPLLSACIRQLHFGPTWVETRLPTPVIWDQESDPPAPPVMTWIDLKHEPGIRVYVREGTGHTNVWLQIHHACSDGQGSRRFIVDLFTAYCRKFPHRHPCPEYDALNYDRLLKREARFPPPGAVAQRKPKFNARESFGFLTEVPMVLPTGGNKGDRIYPQIYKHAFTSDETAAIRARARQEGSTLNNVALGHLLGALAQWSLERGKRPSHYLRILVPMDLRERIDEFLPVANRMGFTFVTRRLSVCEDWVPLLTGLREEARFVQKYYPSRDFLNNMNVAWYFPMAVWLFQRLPLCFSSAVLTNLGDPTRRFRRRFPERDGMITIGDASLEQIYGSPPLRPQTPVGLGLAQCARRMAISAHFDSRVFGEAESRSLLDAFVERWFRWLNSPVCVLPGAPVAAGADDD